MPRRTSFPDPRPHLSSGFRVVFCERCTVNLGAAGLRFRTKIQGFNEIILFLLLVDLLPFIFSLLCL